MILDQVIATNRSSLSRPGGPYGYFDDELKDAQALATEWALALFEGMSTGDIVRWTQLVDPPMSVRQALVLHNAKVKADELEQHEADQGRPSLGFRFKYGNITVEVEQIVVEVKRRRGLASSG